MKRKGGVWGQMGEQEAKGVQLRQGNRGRDAGFSIAIAFNNHLQS